MKRGWLTRCVLLGLVVAMLAVQVYGVSASANPLDSFAFVETPYTYENSSSTENNTIIYNDGMLLTDANTLSADLAKVSVGLSMAAYSQSTINNVLTSMGFYCWDNTVVYSRESTLSIYDNDYAAYTVATKTIEYGGEEYIVYCVPVKGTSANSEWYSNFNLGSALGNRVHEGFEKPAKEILDKLETMFANDSYSKENRIIWLTGHSRGAAVANLVSGWLTEDESYALSRHIFGYTFGCPAVSKDADTGLQNIYNFNNAGDFMTLFPRKEWDYYRYGVDITLSDSTEQGRSLIKNLGVQYPMTTVETYQGLSNSAAYEQLLGVLVKEEKDFHKPENQLALKLLAYAFGGFTQTTLVELVNASSVDIVLTMVGGTKLGTVIDVLEQLVDGVEQYAKWILFIEKGIEDLGENPTAEDFEEFVSLNQDTIDLIAKQTGLSLTTYADMDPALKSLSEDYETAMQVKELLDAGLPLLLDSQGQPLAAVRHGHAQLTYTAWINAAYYGYHGWYGNSDLTGALVIPDGCSNIGASCFSDCTEITSLVIPDSVRYLGDQSFGDCEGLTQVTLPVDYDYTGDPFYSTGAVEKIHYTYGKSGVMPDRTKENYADTLEHYSSNRLKEISFDDGITQIGDYAFYTVGSDARKGHLTKVTLPAALKRIGAYAFSHQVDLTTVDLPDGLEELGKSCFYGASALSAIEFPGTLTKIPEYCFAWCESLTELVIPDTVTSLGESAFANCIGLSKVTVPVDYDFANIPFYTCNGVNTICYTYGETGVMPDRTEDNYKTSLEYYAGPALKTVEFEEGITRIGNYAYYSLPARKGQLTNIKLPSTLTSLGEYAFYYQSALSKLVLPEGLTAIGRSCFSNNSALTQIWIPTSVKTIDRYAFYWCDVLEKAYYCGTQDQWDAITIGIQNTYLTNRLTFHSFTVETEAADPTCTQPGSEGVKCEYCALEKEIPATGHSYGGPTWNWSEQFDAATAAFACGACQDVQKLDAQVNSQVNAASCTTDGSAQYTACVTFEETQYSDAQSVTLTAPGHSYESSITTNATCTADGVKTYTCSACADSYTEAISAPGHSYTSAVTKPTCTAGGYTTYTCSVCTHSYIGDEVPAAAHTPVTDPAVKATCTAAGKTEGSHCSECGTVLAAQTEIPATGHTSVTDPAVKATCTATGKTEGSHCSECGAVLVEQTETPKAAHTPVTDPAVTATCTAAGKTEGSHCSECSTVLVEQTVTPVAAHTPVTDPAVTASCTAAGKTEGSHCSECGTVLVAQSEIPAVSHNWGDWTVSREATAASEGEEVRSCANCSATESRSVPALDNPFTDVREGEFFYEPVLWAVGEGITTGTSPTTFSPMDPCTRAQVVTFLWRAAGEPEPGPENPFADVTENDYFYKAVLWAVENGITNGTGATTFSPAAPCTRGQVVTFLWRSQGEAVPTGENAFADVREGQYYYNAVLWAVENGITNGMGVGRFEPNTTCNRGQIVTFLYRTYN